MEPELSGIFRVKLVTKNIVRGSPGTQFMHMRVKKALLHTILLLVFQIIESLHCILKETHRKKAPLNETKMLTKSMNMDILAVGKSRLVNKRFLNKVSKKSSYWKNSVTFDSSFCIAHSIVLTCWKEQSFICTAYLMNHLFQT